MGNLVSQADYARRRGVSEAMITKYKDQGRLVMEDNLVDVEESDKRIAATMDPARGGDRNGGGEDAPEGSYYELRNRELRARVLKLELENKLAAGELVVREEVDQETFARTAVAQRELLQVPDLCAALVADEFQPAVRKCVDEVIRRICEGLADKAIRPTDAEMLAWLEAEALRMRGKLVASEVTGDA